ncbi:MAG: PD-(D/E)XK nuclease family protein [Mariprofundaceae bacterium]|nr:PD-(D/E)XK nuclease family protein [Mariprofundaceae bacterium]
MQALLNEKEVWAALKDGAFLIVASSRLAADWKRRVIAAAPGHVCETPSVFSWSAWIREMSRQLQTGICLTRLQEQQLWEQVIHQDLQRKNVRLPGSLRGLARHAAEAYALIREYRMDTDELVPGNEESEALAHWIAAMQQKLKAGALRERLLAADVPGLICSMMPDLVLPQCIMLDGFASFSPMQRHIMDALRQAGCECVQVKVEPEAATPVLIPCPEEAVEYRHIAVRVQALLRENPRARIAVLTSESITDVSALRRVLDEVLMPEALNDPAVESQAVSMPGRILPELPMIQQILHLLSMAGQTNIRFDDFSALLFSPWLKGFEAERIGRARLDAMFRRQNRHRLSWKGLLQSSAVKDLPLLSSVLRVLAGWDVDSKSANGWVKAVHGLLRSTGFVPADSGDEGRRSNMEIRQMNVFREVLISLAAADAVGGKMSWMKFLAMLRSACAENRLTLTAKYPNVVVMPLARIAGLRFDHVLVAGLDEEALPPPARPHPLLPLPMQRKYGLPMSTASLVFEFSRHLWQQLLHSATTVEISWAQQKDERDLLPSSFVVGLERRRFSEMEAEHQHMEMESFDDAPDVSIQPDEEIHGGTKIISNQSACPFRAFATHRLNIAGLDETVPGIAPSTKGSLIHDALDFIWKRLDSQQALLALSETRRMDLIEAAVAHAWEKNRSPSDASVRSLEGKRMRCLLAEWLELETGRPPFRVLETEEKYELRLPFDGQPQFTIHIKADRLDQDADGHRILLDYKTGAKQPVSKWLGERMEEPQLPLYALAAGLTDNDAVAFASVRSGRDMGFEGLAAEDIGIAGLTRCDGKRGRPENWRQVLDEWRRHINALAREFAEGRCDVSPRDANACKYCALEAVCRIGETGFDPDADDASEGEEP